LAAILVMAAIGAWAIGTDRVSYVVTNGVSMNPVYYAGDLVIIIKADSYETGQIAAYHGSRTGLKVLHRIIGGNAETGYIFKGDNNPQLDLQHPTADQMIGRAVLHIPKGGYWLSPLFGPTGLGMLGFLFVGGTAAKRTRRNIPRGRRKKKVKAMSRQGGPAAMALAVVIAVKRLPPLSRAAAVLATVAATLGLLMGVIGWMKPVREVHRADLSSAPSITYSYKATVSSSPAYDSTAVGPPDPVFRKLTDTVDITVKYAGDPGAFDISLAMRTTSGWHTTQQILTSRKFTGRQYAATVTLDLKALEDRADAAAKSIGVPPGAISITVTARVMAAGVTRLSAPLPFQLTPLVLGLMGGETSLKTTGTAAGTTATAREISVFGYTITTAAKARSWAVLLLLLALTTAVVVFLAARRAAPARTRAEIERLYPQLLVPVEPMPSPPGKPVVNVDDFRALAKLAERYGQMILTWRRPEADDFVVRDEGITYRYRIPLDGPALDNVELISRPSGAGTHRRKASSEVS
jgi:signal peptidase I